METIIFIRGHLWQIKAPLGDIALITLHAHRYVAMVMKMKQFSDKLLNK